MTGATVGILIVLQLALASAALAANGTCEVMPAPDPLSRKVEFLHPDEAAPCSVRALITHLDMAVPPRGEFETTAEYEARKVPEATPSGLLLARPYALVLPVSPIHIHYDADAEGFRVVPGYAARGGRILNGLVNTGYFYTAVPERGVLVETERTFEHSEYEGQNGFGATVSISKTGGESWGIFLRWDASASALPEATWPTIAVPRSDAPSAKDKLAVVLIGASNAPAAFKKRDHTLPTMDQPTETDILQHALRIAPAYALVVRKDTGQVLARMAYTANGSETVLPVGEDMPTPVQEQPNIRAARCKASLRPGSGRYAGSACVPSTR